MAYPSFKVHITIPANSVAKRQTEIIHWCSDTIPTSMWYSSYLGTRKNAITFVYSFCSKEDATIFKLTWC